MSRQRNSWKATLCFTTILALAAIPAAAFNPQPEPPGSVAVGVLPDQYVRISFVNSTDRVSGIVPCVCPVKVVLLDELGQTLGSEEMEVDPGAIGSVEVDPGGRTIVRGLVELTGNDGARLACNLGARAGLEIIQADDGATLVAVPIVTSYLPSVPD